jgi:hypothetical protein
MKARERARLLELTAWAVDVFTESAANDASSAVVALPQPRSEAQIAAAIRAGVAASRARLRALVAQSGAVH